MDIKAFFDPVTSTVTYLVSDPVTSEAAIIDPVLDFDPASGKLGTRSTDRVLEDAEARALKIVLVLDTHAHADHLSGADYVRSSTGATYAIGEHIRDVQTIFRPVFNAADMTTDGQVFDRLLSDGEAFKIGSLSGRVLHTPGHTPVCVTFLIEDAAFVGDTLFMPDYGTARADFPGGDAATLYRSIRKILSLPQETRIFVGHDYLPAGRSEYRWETTVGEEKTDNRHVHDGVSEGEFVKMRTERDATLAAPRLILPSLQVNIRAGSMPPTDTDGKVYLRIPVTRVS